MPHSPLAAVGPRGYGGGGVHPGPTSRPTPAPSPAPLVGAPRCGCGPCRHKCLVCFVSRVVFGRRPGSKTHQGGREEGRGHATRPSGVVRGGDPDMVFRRRPPASSGIWAKRSSMRPSLVGTSCWTPVTPASHDHGQEGERCGGPFSSAGRSDCAQISHWPTRLQTRRPCLRAHAYRTASKCSAACAPKRATRIRPATPSRSW